jgi:uncharacterized protein YkwD
MALATLAMSAGFAADRLLFSEPNTQLVFEEHPTGAATTQSGDTPERSRRAPSAAGSVDPAPPLKRVQRPTTPGTPAAPAQSGPAVSMSSAEDAVARLTNRERAKAGCRPLRLDGHLRTAARRHSTDMAAHGYFGHIAPGGATFIDRLKAAGYRTPGAENIAKGYRSSGEVVAGWMKSPGHRANILNCGLRALGVGVHYGAGGPWWTQDFGWD